MEIKEMNLIFSSKWRFEGCEISIPEPAAKEFEEILLQIASGKKSEIEDFKRLFGAEGESSSFSWSLTDLNSIINSSSINAALFIEKFWNCIILAETKGKPTPSVQYINSILSKHGIPLALNPPNLDSAIDFSVSEMPSNHPSKDGASPFTLKEQIGFGGFGVVYKAVKKTTIDDFEYALKFLDPSPFIENYAEAFKRFQREVKAVRSLSHKSIIYYYEAGITQDKKPYLAMQFIDGIDLRTAISSETFIDGLEIFIEVLDALDYAHSKGVIHRDLKPSNIIVRNSDRQPIILDFGSAYIIDSMDSHTLTTHQIGTFGYIPSEILSDPKLRSPLQDIYACGMILYESYAGRLPDPANYIPLSEINGEYSHLDPIIKDAICGQAQRMNSANIFSNRLKQVVHILKNDDDGIKSSVPHQNVMSLVQTEFSESDLMTYRDFSDSLYNCYKQIRSDAAIVTSYESIRQSLEELYHDICLDIYVTDINRLANCFVIGEFRCKNVEFLVYQINDFLEILEASTQSKRDLIIRNITTKIKTVNKYNPPLSEDSDLPF